LHTAGPVGPTVFENNPAEVISVNVEGTLSLLRYAIQHDCQSFVFASTHEVYGQAEGKQIESSPAGVIDPMNPRSCYVLAKQTAENCLTCYSKQYGLHYATARFSRLYGPLMNLDSGLFLCDFINDALVNCPVRVRGGQSLLRPLCYIADAAEAMLRMLVNDSAAGAYNVQGDELPTLGEIAHIVSSFSGSDTEFVHAETESCTRNGHWLDTDKLKSLGWQQNVTLHDGLHRTLDYFREVGVNK
jgi:nucleoside-diphosphate-sugar epimerase